MKITYLSVFVFGLGISFLACKDRGSPASDQTTTQVPADSDDRSALAQKWNELSTDIEEEISRSEKQLNEMREDLKEEYEGAKADLQRKKEALKGQWQELETKTQAEWENAKTEFQNELKDLQHEYQEFAQKFSSVKETPLIRREERK